MTPHWALLLAGGLAGGLVVGYKRERQFGVAMTARDVVSTMLRLGPQAFVPIEHAVMVPKGLLATGAHLSESWSTVLTGYDVLAEARAFVEANGGKWGKLATVRGPNTTGPQSNDPAKLLSFNYVAGSDKNHDLTAWVGPPDVSYQTAGGLVGSQLGLSVFPKVKWRPYELRTWFRHHDLWTYSGPAGWRQVALRLFFSLVPPGVRAFWKCDTVSGPYGISDQEHPNLPRGAYGQRFTEPSEAAVFGAYLVTCFALAGLGYLGNPEGPGGAHLIPRFKKRDSGGLLGQVFGGMKETVFEHAGVALGAVLGNPSLMMQAGAQSAILKLKTAEEMARRAKTAEGQFPWHESWEPVLVDGRTIGSEAAGAAAYHSFGRTWDDLDTVARRFS